MNIKKLAKKLPFPIKQSIKRIYGTIPPHFRYDKVFWDTYNFLQESQWWNRQELEDYQMQQLSNLLDHAYENVPYYRAVFDERGLKPRNIKTSGDLKKLPYLTREIIQKKLPDLIARNYPKSKLQYVTTGGSTGIPLGFYYEKDVSEAKEWAFIVTQWERVGFKMGDKCVVLRGNIVESASRGRFWEYEPINKNLILSSYHMTDEMLPRYIERIRRFKPDFIQAYPSTITILAKFMKKHNIEPFPSVKALLCGSENLYPWQRGLLEETLRCRVYSWYGHSERAVLASECEKSIYYHICPEYGIVELVGSDDKLVTGENQIGEIVATGLNNFVCPLIRYRTMDLASILNTKCECGRDYVLLKNIEGRSQEFIITGTGRLISMTAINMHSDVFDNVKQFQFYQEKQGEVIFNVIKSYTYTERDTEYIRSELYKKLGDDIKMEIHFVDNISLTKSGKYRFLVQKLPIGFQD